MKRLKLILLMCLVALIALIAVACGGTEASDTTVITTTEAGVVTTPAVTTPANTTPANTTPVTTVALTQFEDLKIGEIPISDYTIVYAKSPYKTYSRSPDKKQYFPVYDFDHETADRLSDLIFEVTGVRLNVVQDVGSSEVVNEILIGETNRAATGSAGITELTSDDYVLNVVGNKFVICGGEFGTTWHAIDYLEVLFADKLSNREAEFSFANDFLYKGKYHLTVFGCIGDSITQGYGSSGSALYSYPAQMSRLLWKDAIVLNFGSSGATMRSDLADAYTKRGVYSTAVKAASGVDIFTIMLGTNDSDRDQSWTDADTREYKNSCLGIMKALQRQNHDLEFVLANCPAYFGTDTYGSAKIRQIQEELISTVNEAKCPTTFFDMYKATENMSEHFPGGLHPNDMGYLKIAQAFAEYLQTLITPVANEAK